MSDIMVKISVVSLIVGVVDLYEEKIQHFAVRHTTDPSKPWQALSAGTKFPAQAQRFLQERFGAAPEGFSGDDARCLLPESEVVGFSSWLKKELNPGSTDFRTNVQWWPMSELWDRLTTPYWEGIAPPLSPEDHKHVFLLQKGPGLIQQPPPYDENERGGRGATVRFFLPWVITFTHQIVAEKFFRSPAVLRLSLAELATTEGGRCIGVSDGGFKLANNLGVEHCGS